ncbi:MAG: AAA family ATPase [Caldiserica bacterium]|nr:AAA family ATPase [Caldisericota bacterium]
MSAHVILITGPRASGKSTFAAEAHRALVGSVLLHVDDLFHEVLAQGRNRWMGNEAELYAVILRHQLALARDLAATCTVIVDGTVLPDQLAPLVDNPPAPRLDVLVLLPSLEECLANEHFATRAVPVREEKVTTTWQEMQEWRVVTGVSVRIIGGPEVERGRVLSSVVKQLLQTL